MKCRRSWVMTISTVTERSNRPGNSAHIGSLGGSPQVYVGYIYMSIGTLVIPSMVYNAQAMIAVPE